MRTPRSFTGRSFSITRNTSPTRRLASQVDVTDDDQPAFRVEREPRTHLGAVSKSSRLVVAECFLDQPSKLVRVESATMPAGEQQSRSVEPDRERLGRDCLSDDVWTAPTSLRGQSCYHKARPESRCLVASDGSGSVWPLGPNARAASLRHLSGGAVARRHADGDTDSRRVRAPESTTARPSYGPSPRSVRTFRPSWAPVAQSVASGPV
jgi:hypothetical protein